MRTSGKKQLKSFLEVALSTRTRQVLLALKDKQGLTQYESVKQISKEQDLATSTIKLVLARLRKAGLIDYNSRITLTNLGLILIKSLEEQNEN